MASGSRLGQKLLRMDYIGKNPLSESERMASSPGFCETYSVDYPVVLAGMAMISEPPLVAAVSQAGGLGILGTGPMSPDILRGAIAEVRKQTPRTFGVNQIVENTQLGPLTTTEDISALVEEQVPLVVFFWNLPSRDWLNQLRDGGIRIWQTVTSLEDAQVAIDAGVDGLMVQGSEAGGHNRSTLQLRDLLYGISALTFEGHVIAAGGIADVVTARAAINLGADAVCLGTRFVASLESPAHPDWKRRIVEAKNDSTVVTRIFGPEWPDAPMRVLHNRACREEGQGTVRRIGSVGRTRLFGQTYDMPACSAVLPTLETQGDLEFMCLAAGTSSARIHAVSPAADIVREIGQALVG